MNYERDYKQDSEIILAKYNKNNNEDENYK